MSSSNKEDIQVSYMTKNSRRLFPGSKLHVYAVNLDHLTPREIQEYRELVTCIYASPVTLAPMHWGSDYWLSIRQMNISEIGLKVARHFYGVEFWQSDYQN